VVFKYLLRVFKHLTVVYSNHLVKKYAFPYPPPGEAIGSRQLGPNSTVIEIFRGGDTV